MSGSGWTKDLLGTPEIQSDGAVVANGEGSSPVVQKINFLGLDVRYNAAKGTVEIGGAADIGSGTSAGSGTTDVAVTNSLQDGDVAIIEATIVGIDTVTGDAAVYVRELAVRKTAGAVSALAGVGLASRLTAEEDPSWAGPTAIVDVGGQAGIRLSGDATNATDWSVRSSYRKVAT